MDTIVDERYIEVVVQETLSWPSNRKWHTRDKEARIRSFFGFLDHPEVYPYA